MQIFVKDISNKSTTFDVEPGLSIADFKNKIHDKLGVPPAQQKVVFAGKALTEGTLADYQVKHESTMHLVLVASASAPVIAPVPVIVAARAVMHIFVKVSLGQTLTIEVEPSDSIEILN